MELPSSPEFIISCEHAGNQVPEDYQSLFDGANDVLNSHRGWDPGALELAQILAKKTNSELYTYLFTRLIIEPNWSIGHPKLFSEFTRDLKKSDKEKIIENYYQPYRNSVIEAIHQNAAQDIPTIHISIHTFTPFFDETTRDFEIGLLYDPTRTLEKDVCQNWKSILEQAFPDFRIRMNQPYKGSSDGFTTFLRKLFDEKLYLGIELEVNQRLFFKDSETWRNTCVRLIYSFLQLNQK